MKTKKQKDFEQMPVVNAKAAGIDVGSKTHFVAVGQQKDEVREFGCYTSELHELCNWLMEHSITKVALESTGSYWQPLFIMLQAYGLEPILVNGRFTKNVKGRKTDVLDCQWIQKLHSLGLLEGSFIPDLFTETLRQYCRHRQSLLENAASYISKMQKALRMTNIRLDVAVSDITGVSGKMIIEAIISGEKDPVVLASLVKYKVKKSKEEIIKALTGEWREEYIFELRQCYEVYNYFHGKIAECDKHIEAHLNQRIEDNEKLDGEARIEYLGKDKYLNKNDPKMNLQRISYQLTGGVDLSVIAGVGSTTIITLLSETGIDLSAFPTARHFTSWLRLAPNKKVSGGRVISSRTLKGKSRLADALRHVAVAVGNRLKEGSLHQFYRRIAYRKGKLAAVTATARKIAVIIYNMLTKRQAYKPIAETEYLEKIRMAQVKAMQRRINQLGVRPDELIFASC